MESQRISSSAFIERVRYDKREQVIELVFESGRSYTYKGVPADRIEHLLSSDNPSHFYNCHIKGCYPYE